MPLGTLRYALSYPAATTEFSNDSFRAALTRCGLEKLVDILDQDVRWDKELSLGEQQRLAFARLILHKPLWIFLDEATAALDQDSQHQVMTLFDDELKDTTVLSIGNRPDLATYHTRTLQLIHDVHGERLRIKRPTPVRAPSSSRRLA